MNAPIVYMEKVATSVKAIRDATAHSIRGIRRNPNNLPADKVKELITGKKDQAFRLLDTIRSRMSFAPHNPWFAQPTNDSIIDSAQRYALNTQFMLDNAYPFKRQAAKEISRLRMSPEILGDKANFAPTLINNNSIPPHIKGNPKYIDRIREFERKWDTKILKG